MFVLFTTPEDSHENLRDSKFVIHRTWTDAYGKKKDQPFWSLFLLTPGAILIIFLVSLLIANDALGSMWWIAAWYTVNIAAYGTLFMMAMDLVNTGVHYVVLKVWQIRAIDIREGKMYIFSFFVLLSIVLIALLTFFYPMSFLGVGVALMLGAIVTWALLRPQAVSATNKIGQFLDSILGFLDRRDDYTEMRELLCPQDLKNLSTKLGSIPSRNRSWYLIYRNVKAKMCKPMQR